jgi:hypothetical protein
LPAAIRPMQWTLVKQQISTMKLTMALTPWPRCADDQMLSQASRRDPHCWGV